MAKEPRHSEMGDEGTGHKYFAMIPHTITRGKRGHGLSLPARWLYVYYKSVTGEGGLCKKSTTTIAREAQLGRGTIPAAKEELIKAGLIKVITREGKYHATDQVRLVDIWPNNMQEFKGEGCSPHEQPGCSPHEQPEPDCSPHEQPGCSPHEQSISVANSTEMVFGCSPHEQPGCSPHERGCSPHEQKKKDLKKNNFSIPDLNTHTLPPTPLKGEGVCVSETEAIAQMESAFTTHSPGFKDVCATYPAARLEGLAEAWQTWYSRDLEPRAAEIVAKIERLTQTTWKSREPRYVPLLKTWLDKGRYNDPPVSLDVVQEVTDLSRATAKEQRMVQAGINLAKEIIAHGTKRQPALPQSTDRHGHHVQ